MDKESIINRINCFSCILISLPQIYILVISSSTVNNFPQFDYLTAVKRTYKIPKITGNLEFS